VLWRGRGFRGKRLLHHDSVGRVIVITPEQDRFFYWLKFDPNPTNGAFKEQQLEAAA
jgi:hypothetical protein